MSLVTLDYRNANLIFQAGEIEAENIASVYSDLVIQRSTRVQHKRSNAESFSQRRSTILGAATSQELVVTEEERDQSQHLTVSLPETTKKNLIDWAEMQEQQLGKLDRDAFVKAVMARESLRKEPNVSCCPSPRSSLLLAMVIMFPVGGQFAYFAVSAMPQQFMAMMDIEEAGIGTLNTAYFVGALFGPLIGENHVFCRHACATPCTLCSPIRQNGDCCRPASSSSPKAV